MSEINAAFGLLQLKYIDEALKMRKAIDTTYRRLFAGLRGVHCLGDGGQKIANYAYFPILIQADYPLNRDELYHKLKSMESTRDATSTPNHGFSDVPGYTFSAAK